MKKLTSVFLLISILTRVSAQQEIIKEHRPSVALKFAPAGIAIGKITVGGEYNFKHRNSLTFFAGVPFDKSNTFQLDGKESPVTSKAFSLMAGY